MAESGKKCITKIWMRVEMTCLNAYSAKVPGNLKYLWAFSLDWTVIYVGNDIKLSEKHNLAINVILKYKLYLLLLK